MEKNYILYLGDKTIKGTEVEILEAYSQYGGENKELLSLLARAKKVNGFIHFVIDDLELVCKPKNEELEKALKKLEELKTTAIIKLQTFLYHEYTKALKLSAEDGSMRVVLPTEIHFDFNKIPLMFSCQNNTFNLIKVDNTYLEKITEDLPYIQKAINDLEVVLSSYQD